MPEFEAKKFDETAAAELHAKSGDSIKIRAAAPAALDAARMDELQAQIEATINEFKRASGKHQELAELALKTELIDLMSSGQVFRTVQLEGRTHADLSRIRTAISALAQEGLLVVHGDAFENAFVAATPKLFNRK